MMTQTKMKQYACINMDFFVCCNDFSREDEEDFFKYPFCEECQKTEKGKIKRLDDGRHT